MAKAKCISTSTWPVYELKDKKATQYKWVYTDNIPINKIAALQFDSIFPKFQQKKKKKEIPVWMQNCGASSSLIGSGVACGH